WHPRQDPLHDVPGTPDPAVSPLDVHAVAGRILFVEFYVAGQGAAGVTRFQQVVTQHSVFRETTGQGPLEGIYVVNSFADKRAFAENILIHVGHRPRIRIDSRVARKKLAEA